jgi:hypothetical protein
MKKIFGYLFLVIGIFLALSMTLYMIGKIPQIAALLSQGTSYNSGYLIGMLLFDGALIVLIWLLIRTGIRWTKRKTSVQVTHDVLDSELIEHK